MNQPGITFFGENLSTTFDNQLLADRNKVDLLLIIGTSLNVNLSGYGEAFISYYLPGCTRQ